MSVNEAAARARVDAMIDRIVSNPDEGVTDRDQAFALCVGRRWLQRVGGEGPEAQIHTERGDGQRLGWRITGRGNQVAEEHLAATGPEAA